MDTLITQLMLYIASVSGTFSQDLGYDSSLTVPSYQPSVNFVSYNRLSLIKFNRHLDDASTFKVKAAYLFGGSIYLPDDWDKNKIADQSSLLHELVHYMQETNYLTYDCEGDLERLAYYIQEKWLLEEHGLSLYDTIDLNPLGMVAAMMCPERKTLAKPWEGGP